MMKITPFSQDIDLEDYESLEITIRCITHENEYVPIFYISSPSDNYEMKIEELACLMDGIDIARRNIDEIVNYLLKSNDE